MIDSPPRRDARFVFLSDAEAKLVVVGHPDGTRFGWRLDAANHRPLGRAAALAPTLQACRASAALVRDRIDELTAVITPEAGQGVWRWRVALDRATLALSAHAYLRRVECVRAHVQFLAALRAADPDAGVVRDFGPRALRSFSANAL